MNKIVAIKPMFFTVMIVFLFVWLARIIVINHYGVDIPIWDQWDGEVNGMYLPYLNHTLTFKAFFLPHNGHRMFFPRVFSLITFILSKDYNSVLAMQLQAGIVALIAVLFVVWHSIDCKKIEYLSIVVLALLFGLPIGYFNLLSAFHEFYFMNLFSIIAIRLAAVGSISYGRFAAIILFSLAVFLNVASAFCTPLVAAIILLYLATKEQLKIKYLLMSVGLVSLAIVMLILTPFIPPQKTGMLMEQIGFFLRAFINIMIWPYGIGILWWSVGLIFVLKNIKLKKYDFTKYLFPLALYLWVLFQYIAMAYARGTMNARYFDIPLIAIVAMIFLLDQWKVKAANVIKIFIIVFTLAFAYYKSVHKMEHEQQKRLHGVQVLQETMQLMKQNHFALAAKKIQECSWFYPKERCEHIWQILQNKTVFNQIIPSSIRQSIEKK